MINLFSYSANDQSLLYLAQIFGNVNGVIPTPPSAQAVALPAGQTISLLGTMFQTFNAVILAVGALIVVYVTWWRDLYGA